MSARSISVTIAGNEYKIRHDGEGDGAWLERVAREVDSAMAKIRERTGTVDTRDLAVLTALNLARELLDARRTGFAAGDRALMRELIELAEAEVEATVADA